MKQILFIALLPVLGIACGSNNNEEDRLKQIDKQGAVESKISITHLGDTADLLTTTHTVWKNNVAVKLSVKYDTLPSLGKTQIADQNDTLKTINKDYEIYITVKE